MVFKKIFSIFLVLGFLACGDSSSETELIQPIVENVEENLLEGSLIVDEDTVKETYPSFKCLDGSWNVILDIQEGFLLNYTIDYKLGKDIFVDVSNTIPADGVDHPEPHFIDSVTYFIPNIGGCNRGYFSMYIYKDGTCEYKEKVQVIYRLKEEMRKDTLGKYKAPIVEETYWASRYHTVFNSSCQVFDNPKVSSTKITNALSFYITSKIDSFFITGDSLKVLDFVYTEYSGLYWREGKHPYKGSIKGVLLEDNTWQLEVDVFIRLKNEKNNKKIDRHIQFNKKYKQQ